MLRTSVILLLQLLIITNITAQIIKSDSSVTPIAEKDLGDVLHQLLHKHLNHTEDTKIYQKVLCLFYSCSRLFLTNRLGWRCQW